MKQVCRAFLLVFLGLSGLAQESAAPRVAIPLIANDSHHRLISVTVESLVIKDQRTPVAGASLLRGSDLPVELGVLIDASNSERDAHLDDFVQAAKQFVDNTIRGPEDRAFFLGFNATLQATGWLKKEQLQSTPVKVVPGGGTAVYDALFWACKQRMGLRDWRKPTRRILVLISDGEDNMSHVTRDYAATQAIEAGTVIFTVDTGNSGMPSRGERVMENIATSTGGESFSRSDRKGLPKIFASIQELVDGMSYLSYVPPDASKRAVHEVDVKPAPKEKFKLSYPKKYLWNP